MRSPELYETETDLLESEKVYCHTIINIDLGFINNNINLEKLKEKIKDFLLTKLKQNLTITEIRNSMNSYLNIELDYVFLIIPLWFFCRDGKIYSEKIINMIADIEEIAYKEMSFYDKNIHIDIQCYKSKDLILNKEEINNISN